MRAWLVGLLIPFLLSGSGGLAPVGGYPPSVQPAAQDSIEITDYDEAVDRDSYADGTIAILCDPEKFRLSIRVADAASLDRSYPKRAVVSAEALIQQLPNHGGEMQYRGALIRYAQCGPYSIRLMGGFYNADREGALGGYPSFVIARLSADNRMIVPDDGREGVSIGECERGNRLAPDCPADWAVRLDAGYDSKREKVVVDEYVRSTLSLSDDPAIGREHGERHYAVARPLGMWEHARDDRAAQAKGTP